MISRIILRLSVVPDVAGWVLVKLFEFISQTTGIKKVVCVVQNTISRKLVYFCYDSDSDLFVDCDKFGEIPSNAERFASPRELVNARIPSKKGHSIMKKTFVFDNRPLKEFKGNFCRSSVPDFSS